MRGIVGLVLVAFACGVAWLQTWAALPAHPAWMAGAGAIALGVASAARDKLRPAWLAALVVAAALLAGCGYAAWRAQVRMAEELPREWEGVDIEIVGVVADLPANSPQGTRFAFTVERVRTPGAVVPSELSLAWFAPVRPAATDDEVPVVHAGERWYLTVRLKRPHGTVNPGAFDLEAWLLQQGFRATGYVHPEGLNARRDLFAARPGDYVQRARERIRERIVAALTGAPYAGVIAALAIGDQRAIPEAQWTVFNRTGVSHLISISGLARHGVRGIRRRHGLRACPSQRTPDDAHSRTQGGCDDRRRRGRRLRAAGGCRRSRGTHVRDAVRCRLRPVARSSGHRRNCLAVGARRRAAVGPVGDADPRFLAFVLRRRSLVVCVGGPPARRRASGLAGAIARRGA